MHAMQFDQYGAPDVLTLRDVDVPRTGSRDVLIRVIATSVNPVDCKIRSGMQRGIIRYRLPRTIGLDVSGVVVAVGPRVRRFSVGDAVFSSPNHRGEGTYAEYVAVRESELAMKPASIPHIEAATLPLVGLTAWESLFGRAGLAGGEHVLIHAGSGGVGSVAIQLAKSVGAEVTATAGAANHELLRQLGADHVIDYRRERFEDRVSDVDVVLDNVGGDTKWRSLSVLRSGGRMVSIVSGLTEFTKVSGPTVGLLRTIGEMIKLPVVARLRFGARGAHAVRPSDGLRLAELAAAVDASQLRAVVDRVFDLEDLAEAHRYSETGRVRGKIAIRVAPEP